MKKTVELEAMKYERIKAMKIVYIIVCTEFEKYCKCTASFWAEK